MFWDPKPNQKMIMSLSLVRYQGMKTMKMIPTARTFNSKTLSSKTLNSKNTQLENTQLENTHEAAPSTDSQAVSNELPSVSTELNIEEEREPERVEFVFTGPENPFNEPFPAEEMVADAFTQVIGHSPLRPNRPLSVAATQTEETAPRTPTPTADQTLDENVNSDITRLDSPGTPTSPDDSSDVPQTMDSNSTSVDSAFEPPTTEQGFNQAVGSPAPLTNSEIFPANLETTPVPETASEPSQSTTESIADYLAKSSEAVTFGGGQGIYSNQFPVTEESHSPIPALNQQTAPDVSKENDVVDEISQTVQKHQTGNGINFKRFRRFFESRSTGIKSKFTNRRSRHDHR